MPTKGRLNPCHDPLKRGHKKQSQYKDVNTIGSHLLQEFRDKLPEFRWKDGTRMCSVCRSKAIKEAAKRSDLVEGVHEVDQLLNLNGNYHSLKLII